jgi:hypothetical protein
MWRLLTYLVILALTLSVPQFSARADDDQYETRCDASTGKCYQCDTKNNVCIQIN